MRDYTRRQFLADATAMSALVTVPKVFAQGSRISDAPAFKSATELALMIQEEEISSVELTQYFIGRIEKYDYTLNAIVIRDFDRALEAAKAADDSLSRGEISGPLHGLPMTIKEAYNIEGLPTSWGIPELAENIALTDSAMVSSYKAAGAHFMGKTNVPLALADLQSYNEIYGTTNNPWDISRTPGGSSGGSAAALAAGMTVLDSGSDIGGSIRNPAHFCGVYGHKPTWGIVPSQGHALPGSIAVPDLAVLGPLARSAEDLVLAMEVVAGADVLNKPGWQLKLPRPRASSLGDLRVAVWPTEDISPADRVIVDRVQEITDMLANAGAKVSDTARPAFSPRDAHYAYTDLLFSPISSGLTDEMFEQNKKEAAGFRSDDISAETIKARAATMDHRTWLKHDEIRTQIRMQWQRFFQDWDILICPIMVTTAFSHDHSIKAERTLIVNEIETPYLDQLFWAGLATLGSLPSTVFPTGLSEDGLPIGLQCIGAEFDDYTTIEFARLVSQEIGGFVPPMGYEG